MQVWLYGWVDLVGGVDGAGLQGGEDFVVGKVDGDRVELVLDFVVEVWYVNLQVLDVSQVVDFFVELVVYLYGGVVC